MPNAPLLFQIVSHHITWKSCHTVLITPFLHDLHSWRIVIARCGAVAVFNLRFGESRKILLIFHWRSFFDEREACRILENVFFLRRLFSLLPWLSDRKHPVFKRHSFVRRLPRWTKENFFKLKILKWFLWLLIFFLLRFFLVWWLHLVILVWNLILIFTLTLIRDGNNSMASPTASSWRGPQSTTIWARALLVFHRLSFIYWRVSLDFATRM